MKRTLFRKMAVILAVIVLMVSSAAVNVYAGASGWQKDQVGWWYLNEDGSFPAEAWMQENGIWYYFNGEGYLQTGWLLWNGSWYYLEETGMATGWKYIGDAWYYFDEDGRMYSSAYVDGKYYMDENGRWDGKVQEQKKTPMFPGADAYQDLAAGNYTDSSDIIKNQNLNNMRGLLIRNENIRWDGNTRYLLSQSYDAQTEIPGSVGNISGPYRPQELIPEEKKKNHIDDEQAEFEEKNKNNINDEQAEIPGTISDVPQVSGSSNDNYDYDKYFVIKIVNNGAYIADVKVYGYYTSKKDDGSYVDTYYEYVSDNLSAGDTDYITFPRNYEGWGRFSIRCRYWYLFGWHVFDDDTYNFAYNVREIGKESSKFGAQKIGA